MSLNERARTLIDELKFALRRVFHSISPWTALNGLDKKLLQHITRHGGVFIEAGANDGIRQSNTFFLEKRRGWTGLLVEPMPRLAKRCKRARRGATTVEALLVAPDDSGRQIELLDLDLMSVVGAGNDGLPDLDAHIASAEAVQRITRTTTHALGRTLSELIDQEVDQPIDLLSLDIEGYELEALRGLDLERHRPEWILIETRRLDAVLDILGNHYLVHDTLSHHDHLLKVRR
jgi:FkbM family methyltransferase